MIPRECLHLLLFGLCFSLCWVAIFFMAGGLELLGCLVGVQKCVLTT